MTETKTFEDESTIFEFAKVASTNTKSDIITRKFINKDTFVQIRHRLTKTWLCLEAPEEEGAKV